MAKIERFEGIQAWQKSRELNKNIYQVTTNPSFSKDFTLKDQIRRASISIMANIAEGFGRKSNKEFANFLNIAHSSVCEVQSHLCVALDLGYVGAETFKNLYELLDEVSRMIRSLAVHLRRSK